MARCGPRPSWPRWGAVGGPRGPDAAGAHRSADPPAQPARHGGAAAAGDRRPRPPPRPRFLLLFCDLDGLKEINDTAGHAAGDQALVEFAHRLAGALRAGDGAARLGGDEFVALVPHLERADPEAVVARLAEATTFTLRFERHELPVAASTGWVVFDDGSRPPATSSRRPTPRCTPPRSAGACGR
ncbi:MAG: GGDEF domain-containing protein [Acidimicrobiales bacterium]